MSDKRFPNATFPYPSKLTAVANGLRDYDVAPLVGNPIKVWDRFLDKLRNKTRLTNLDRTTGLISVHLIPNELLPAFRKLFTVDLNAAYFSKIAKKFTSELAPEGAISILLAANDNLLQDGKVFPSTLRLLKEKIEFYSHENLALLVANEKSPIQALLGVGFEDQINHLTTGQVKIIETLKRLESVVTFFEQTIRELPDFLFNRLENQALAAEHLDGMLEAYLRGHTNWETEVLSSRRPVGILLTWIGAQTSDRRRLLEVRPAIKRILQAAVKIDDALKELAASEIERADYWRLKLEYCSSVLPRKFKRGNAKVGVAFGVGEFVICEFAPSGNAAFLYRETDFELKIKDAETWRFPELGQAYPGLTTAGVPGQIRHTGSWQSVLDRLLEAIKR